MNDTKIDLTKFLFSISARFSAIPGEGSYDMGFFDVILACRAARAANESEEFRYGMSGRGEDSEYAYLATECGEPDPDSFWGRWKRKVVDIEADGILTYNALRVFCDELNAFANNSETLGTLGGPLGGLVPDIDFTVESQVLIACIRVTPFNPDWSDDYDVTEDWPYIVKAVREEFGI